jgi:hypothetical protein
MYGEQRIQSIKARLTILQCVCILGLVPTALPRKFGCAIQIVAAENDLHFCPIKNMLADVGIGVALALH